MTHSSLKLLFVGMILYCTSCKNGSANSSQNSSDSDSLVIPANSLDTKPPSANYKPAFPGQWRAPETKTQTPLNIEVLDTTLGHPWGICNLPDGRLLITDKFGTARIETLDGKLDKKIAGFPHVFPKGQGGLLDINIDPNFATNRIIYFDYSEIRPDSLSVLAIAKATLSKDETKIENPTVIFRATPWYKGMGRSLQYGSRIVLDKQGNLFVTTGERSDDSVRGQAQWLSSYLGKVLHITPDGKPVHDASFPDSADAKPEIYAYGLRSPEGLVMNPETGELWEGEFGPKGGDEINIIKPGKNYGWPIITYGIEYRGVPVGDTIQQKAGMEQPVYYWNPVVAASGIDFYYSDSIPEWKGNLFLAGLAGSRIDRLVIKNDKVVGEEWLLTGLGQRFRAVKQAKNGALYAITDQGRLYKISKK